MQANSSLAVFWTMARILSDADVLLKVQSEISDALASSGGVFTLEMLQQLPYLGYCIKVNCLPAFVVSVLLICPNCLKPCRNRCACTRTAFSYVAS
jgi:hypothetical protein